MIFPFQVKAIAEKAIRDALAYYAGRMEFLFEPRKFDVWARLCSDRLNQMDLAGLVPSRWAGERFVKQCALVYADVQLKKLGDGNADITAALNRVNIDEA